MLETLFQQIISQSALEVLAVLCSLAYVHLATKQHLACWPFALASTGLYTWIFWETSLFFQSILNAWYLIMAVYGWFNWKKAEVQQGRGVSSWGLKVNLGIISGLSVASLGLFYGITNWVEQEVIVLDLALAVFSGFVTYMLAQKVLENWFYWMVINLLTAWLCFQQGLLLTALLYGIYVLYAIKGYLEWKEDSPAVPQTVN